MTLSRSLLAALVGVALLALGGGAGAQTAAGTPMLVSTVTSSDALPFFYAKEHGWFEKAGLDVTVQISPGGGAAMVAALVGGALQVVFVNTLALAAAHQKGLPIVAIAPGGRYNSATPHAQLLVPANSPLRTAKDLEGKVVAVPGLHDLFTVGVKAWLEKNGADPASVKFVEIQPPAMEAALNQQRVDAAAIYVPYMNAAISGGARVLAKFYDAVAPSFLTAVWCANSTWVKEHPDAALRFAGVIHDAAAYTNPHYKELIPFIAQFSKTPVETLEKMQPLLVPPALNPADLQPVIDVAAKYKELSGSFSAKDEIFTP